MRDLLVAPLLAPSVAGSTRAIASLTGLSQSAVSRAWASTYVERATDLGDALPAAGLRLVAAAAHAGNSLLVLVAEGAEVTAASSGMRSPRRAPLQALLATDLAAAGRPGRRSRRRRREQAVLDQALVQTIRERTPRSMPVHVLTRRPLNAESATGATPLLLVDVEEHLVGSAEAWQGLLLDLVTRCTRSTPTELVTGQQLAMEWARGRADRFAWTTTQRPRSTPAAGPSGRARIPPPTSAAVAAQVFSVLLEAISTGRLTAGDRVTETYLARAVHTSRGHARDALRTLAANGLVELEPRRGAVVPDPQIADVLETYAARRALGAVLLRRLVRWRPGSLDAAEAALRQVIDTGHSGNAWATGEADLQFQDALASAGDLRTVPQMFCTLADQLRLYIAVMGLNYTYSIPGMCADDAELMERVRDRDEDGALLVWERKIDDATEYMTTQLAGLRATRADP